MLLSIIIPVFKVEEYIEQCLDSVLMSPYPSGGFEVIAIDDGSPDKCGEILDQYAKQNINLRIIHQQNCGLSVARNRGLEIAQGEYVWFVDSDDWIELGAMLSIEDALKSKPDILELGFKYVWPDKIIKNQQYCWEGLISGCEAYLRNGLPAPAQFTIVKRSLLVENNLMFYPGILHEDTEYKPKLAILAHSAACLNKPVYNYRQRETGSIMSNYGFQNAHDLLVGCRSMVNFISNRPYNKKESAVIGNAIGSNMNHLLNKLARYTGDDHNKITKLLMDHKDLFRWLKKSSKIKYKAEAILFSLNYSATFRFIQLLQQFRYYIM